MGAGDEVVEVIEGAEVRVNRVVPAVGGADRPRHADVVRGRVERVVPALARGGAYRVDGRQIDDVETHLRDRRQPLGGGAERAGLRRVRGRALGPGEELVPAAEQRSFPL